MVTKKLILVLLTALLVFLFSLFFFNNSKPVEIFTIVYISASIVFLIMCWFIFKVEIPNNLLIGMIGIGILVRLSFISFTPIGSDDIYRYMWDGKVQTAGINPYQYLPNDTTLNSLHTNILPQKMNYIDMRTIYFPLSQWLFYIGYQLSGETVWGYKVLLLLFELFTMTAIFLLLKKLKISQKYALLYILCPLPIIHFAIDAHLDGFGLPLLLLAILFYLSKMKNLSYIFLGLSLTIKPIGLVLIPILFLNEKGIANKIKSLAVPMLAFFIQFIPYIITTNPFEAFIIYSKNWTFNGVLFDIIDTFMKFNAKTRMICWLFLGTALLPLYLSKRSLLEKIYYSVLLLMIFSPVVHPWYVAWLAILLPIVPRWSGIMYAATSSLTAFTVLNYHRYGVWTEYPTVLIFEYIPVIILIALELTEGKYHNLSVTIKQN
jgi:alpha-1,6-mannosyltransferase